MNLQSKHRGNFTRGRVTVNREAVERIREYGLEVEAAAKKALAEGVEIIVNDAKSRCPVAASSKAIQKRGLDVGALKDSIKAKRKNGGAVYEISANARDEKGTAYGQYVEFSPRIDRPFLYPAMDANRKAVHDKIANAIHNAINKGR